MFKIFEINKIKGLLKCFKRTQKKDKLDTITLPDSVGPLSRNIPFSSIVITNQHPCASTATGSNKEKEVTRAMYFANTSMKVFHWKRTVENGVTAMLHYYSKTFPGIAWLRASKFYSIGVISSYSFRHTTGLLIHQYFTCQWNQVSPFTNFLFPQLIQISPFANVLILQYFPLYSIDSVVVYYCFFLLNVNCENSHSTLFLKNLKFLKFVLGSKWRWHPYMEI